jgi:gamma-glutamyl phosphate reductase
MTSFKNKINQVGLQAKEASKILAKVSTKQKNEAILAMAGHILKDKELILE